MKTNISKKESNEVVKQLVWEPHQILVLVFYSDNHSSNQFENQRKNQSKTGFWNLSQKKLLIIHTYAEVCWIRWKVFSLPHLIFYLIHHFPHKIQPNTSKHCEAFKKFQTLLFIKHKQRMIENSNAFFFHWNWWRFIMWSSRYDIPSIVTEIPSTMNTTSFDQNMNAFPDVMRETMANYA